MRQMRPKGVRVGFIRLADSPGSAGFAGASVILVVLSYPYYIIGTIHFPFSEQNLSSQEVLKATLVQLDQPSTPATHDTPDNECIKHT